MGPSKQTAKARTAFATALRAQQSRVVAALETTETLDATPILRDDERLSHGEYLTLIYELHHVLLPELAADEIIQFNRQEDAVTRGPRFDALRADYD